MIYRLIYWLFFSHFVHLAYIAKLHWEMLEYERWIELCKFYSETPEKSNYRQNCRNEAKPKGKRG